MASKSRGGLSKREYAAKQAGGNLNYKTGKISAPKKSSSKSSSSNPYSKYQSMDWGSAAEAAKRAGVDTSTGSDFDIAMNEKYNPSNASTLKGYKIGGYMLSPEYANYVGSGGSKENWSNSSQRASQREQASKVYSSSGLSNKPAVYKQGKSTTDSGWRKALSSGLTGLKYTIPGAAGVSKVAEKMGWDLTNILGIPQVQASVNPDDYPGTDAVEKLNNSLFGTDEQILERDNSQRERAQQLESAGFDSETANIIASGGDTNEILNSFNKNNPSNNDDNRRTSSRPVSNPIFQPSQSSNISDILTGGSPQSRPDFSAGQTKDNTLRQLLGNGYFSNGVASNGKGDYGIEGAFSTNKLSEEDNLLNTLLGIPTAQAAENPLLSQSSTDWLGRPYTGYSAQNGGQSTRYGIDTPPTFVPKNTSNEDITSNTGGYNPQAISGGGVAQQYSQQVQNPQQKYYEEAIKNAKKVMKETIKALEKEYAESERTGTEALNKQKREDLQAQSARFSFGLNQDPNSEQAMQYAQRTSNDYAGQLADFLKKLSTAKSQDISSAKQNYYSQKSSAQEKLAQLMAQLQTKSGSGVKASTGSTKISHNDIFNYVNDAISSGGSWQEIADDAASQGIDTSTGSYFDQLMNQANKQNRWA